MKLSNLHKSAQTINLINISEFTRHDNDDQYLYHISPVANQIVKTGILKSGKPTMDRGFYREYSKGKIFLTERSAVRFWTDRIEEHLESQYDNPPQITNVVQIPKTILANRIKNDELGTKDAGGRASYYIEGTINLNPPNTMRESIEIISVDGEFHDIEGDADDLIQQGWQLAKNSPIHILSDKNLNAVATQDNIVVGALFTAWNNEEFSFDVVVDPKHPRQGIAKQLINAAMNEFKWTSDGYDGAHIKADVVNPHLIPLLQRYGFKIERQIGDHTIMIYIPS